jgi:hypothetical protein
MAETADLAESKGLSVLNLELSKAATANFRLFVMRAASSISRRPDRLCSGDGLRVASGTPLASETESSISVSWFLGFAAPVFRSSGGASHPTIH